VTDEAEHHVHQEIEIERLSAELAAEFRQVTPESIETAVRDEFERGAQARVKDFLPLFVERNVRRRLRAETDEE
jgi:hypothetical protein